MEQYASRASGHLIRHQSDKVRRRKEKVNIVFILFQSRTQVFGDLLPPVGSECELSSCLSACLEDLAEEIGTNFMWTHKQPLSRQQSKPECVKPSQTQGGRWQLKVVDERTSF